MLGEKKKEGKKKDSERKRKGCAGDKNIISDEKDGEVD